MDYQILSVSFKQLHLSVSDQLLLFVNSQKSKKMSVLLGQIHSIQALK